MGIIKTIAVQAVLAADVHTAWRVFTDPDSVTRWNFASPD